MAKIWGRFSATPKQIIENYCSLIEAYQRGTSDPRRDPLVRELTAAVNEMAKYEC
jgi:hypothetical protein